MVRVCLLVHQSSINTSNKCEYTMGGENSYMCISVTWNVSINVFKITRKMKSSELPLLFSMVIHKLSCTFTEGFFWYLDDGILSGTKSLIYVGLLLLFRSCMGLALGPYIKPAKCDLFSRHVLSDFPREMKVS